ncbi:hypothetical protein DFP92_102386 [Yoonia sediminilitoris]|uniref:Uncharacterized protein n=2 Tax=Yoonia sediminilitoris TaxID=1286148 RepID=A0A2T6KMH1_9RHOB|nr:hypothetical protein C8N45_102386 [Yoonia sediminilitoris]RCW97669.1 hypothetical protein DFP92_102386 [Yoonia sediminilitoris]
MQVQKAFEPLKVDEERACFIVQSCPISSGRQHSVCACDKGIGMAVYRVMVGLKSVKTTCDARIILANIGEKLSVFNGVMFVSSIDRSIAKIRNDRLIFVRCDRVINERFGPFLTGRQGCDVTSVAGPARSGSDH